MIQIDMDIPKDCNGCPFAVTGNGEYFFCCFDVEKEVDMDSDYRRKDCPLKEVSQEPVLDKIKAEILENAFTVVNPYNTYKYINVLDLRSIEKIIDKYKAESEETDVKRDNM